MCAAHLDDGPLVCIRTDDHLTHVYAASWCADRHDASEGHES